MLITTAPHVNHGQENTGRQESVWREGPEGSPKEGISREKWIWILASALLVFLAISVPIHLSARRWAGGVKRASISEILASNGKLLNSAAFKKQPDEDAIREIDALLKRELTVPGLLDGISVLGFSSSESEVKVRLKIEGDEYEITPTERGTCRTTKIK